MDLEKLHSPDYDTDLWSLWQDEVGRAADRDVNIEVLDRVLERVRQGE
jgi:hypothetical protein